MRSLGLAAHPPAADASAIATPGLFGARDRRVVGLVGLALTSSPPNARSSRRRKSPSIAGSQEAQSRLSPGHRVPLSGRTLPCCSALRKHCSRRRASDARWRNAGRIDQVAFPHAPRLDAQANSHSRRLAHPCRRARGHACQEFQRRRRSRSRRRNSRLPGAPHRHRHLLLRRADCEEDIRRRTSRMKRTQAARASPSSHRPDGASNQRRSSDRSARAGGRHLLGPADHQHGVVRGDVFAEKVGHDVCARRCGQIQIGGAGEGVRGGCRTGSSTHRGTASPAPAACPSAPHDRHSASRHRPGEGAQGPGAPRRCETSLPPSTVSGSNTDV